MKKLVVLLAMTLLMSAVVYPQISIGKGIKGGLNLATVGGADAEKLGSVTGITGFNAGIFLNIGLPGPFSIRPEVIYTVKGAKITGTSPFPFTSTVTVTYVEIPLLVKFSILAIPGAPMKPVVFAGPSLGILLTSKSKTEIPGQPTQETDGKSDTKSTDMGVVVGVGVDLDLIALSLTVDARYTFGLGTFDQSGAPGPSEVKHRVVSVNVGVGL